MEDVTPSPSCLVYLFADQHIARKRLLGPGHLNDVGWRTPSGTKVWRHDLSLLVTTYAVWSLWSEGHVRLELSGRPRPIKPQTSTRAGGLRRTGPSWLYRGRAEMVEKEPRVDVWPLVSVPLPEGQGKSEWHRYRDARERLMKSLDEAHIGSGELEWLLLAHLLLNREKAECWNNGALVAYWDGVGGLADGCALEADRFCKEEGQRLGLLARTRSAPLTVDRAEPGLVSRHQAVVRAFEDFKRNQAPLHDALLERCRIGIEVAAENASV